MYIRAVGARQLRILGWVKQPKRQGPPPSRWKETKRLVREDTYQLLSEVSWRRRRATRRGLFGMSFGARDIPELVVNTTDDDVSAATTEN